MISAGESRKQMVGSVLYPGSDGFQNLGLLYKGNLQEGHAETSGLCTQASEVTQALASSSFSKS